MQLVKYYPRPARHFLCLLCFVLSLPASQSQTVTQQFSNPAKIQVEGATTASLYPSTITVSGMPSALTGVRIGLNELIGLQSDFDILLEGPDGTRVVLLSDVSNALTFAIYDIDFDLEAERAWPGDMLTDVLFLPANVEDDIPDIWPAPGPGAWQQPYPSLAAFEGKNPNGVWKLYVVDDSPAPYQLSVNKGWDLRITAGNALPCTRPGTPYLTQSAPYSATIAWDAHGSTQWEVFYAPDSLAKPEASTPPTIGNVGSSTLALNNLTPATRYVFYVRASCGAPKSKWIGPLHFRTPGDMSSLCNTASDISICSPVALSLAPGNAYTPAGCFSDGEGPESLYRFTAPATGEYTLYVEQGAGEAVRFLYKPESDGCTDQNWQCIYNGIHQYTGAFGPLQAGVTYYLMAEPTNAVSPDFRFSLSPVGVVTDIGLHHITDRYAVLYWAWSDQLTTDLVYSPAPFTPNAATTPTVTGVTNNQYYPTAPFMTPDTDYQIYLRRRNGAETGCWAGPLTVKTLPTCGAVTDISVSTNGFPPNLHFKSGNATSGTFAYTVGPAPYPFPIEGLIDPLTIVTLQGPDFKTHFDNLQIGQTYQCYVRRVCGGSLDPQAWYGPHTFTVPEKCPANVATVSCGGPALTVQTYSEFEAPFLFGCMSQPGFGWGGSGFVQFTPNVTGVYGFQQKNPVLPPGGIAGPVQYAIRRLDTPCAAASWHCLEELASSDTSIFYTDSLLAGVTYQVMLTPMRYSLQSIDFQITECPNDCPPVSGLVATVQNGGTQISLQWNAGAAHDNFLVRYGRADLVKGPEQAGTIQLTTAATTATLTGLLPNELYKIWVCGLCNGQKGPWVAVKPVNTAPVSREITARVTTCSPWCIDIAAPQINYFDIWVFQVSQSGVYRIYADFTGFIGRINLFEDSIASKDCISNQIETATQSGQHLFVRMAPFLEAGKKYILQFSTNRPVSPYQKDFSLGDETIHSFLLGPAPVTANAQTVFNGLSPSGHGSPPQWGAVTVEATHSCPDTAGWTHYYHEGNVVSGYAPDDLLLLSLKKNGNDIGELANQTLTVRHVTPGNIFYQIKNPPAPYVTNPKGWFVMGPFWQVIPQQQPATDVSVRFYFPFIDFLNFQNYLGLAGATPPAKPEDLFFYKINGAYDPNPANGHAGIPAAPGYDADGFWQYANGPAATDSTWRLGTNANGDFYGETVVARFSGGGGGAGGGPGGAFTVSVKTFYPEENQPEVFPVPATDAVYIRWKKTPAQSSSYQIFNSDGRLVQSGRLGQDGQETLEIGSFPAGVYLLWIKTETGAVMYRLVKI